MANHRRHEVTAFIYDKRGRLLSMGKNSYVKTHPMQAEHASAVGRPLQVFMHAEIAAIIKCKDIDKAHSIEIFRFDAAGRPANSKPCPICKRALSFTQIKKISHT